ncbi:G5 domain-containing protein [Neobacillus jeddahensis]|uniref:G5 domain-containing protein n=1 Tax=Neobacillus jeddahensis TaxID=1461580 RepID=UPI000590B7CF|nr:G5 domain-containing protein [Neobacillus jeddahensis]
MRNSQGTKFFLTLLLCTVYTFGFSNYGALAYDHLFNNQFKSGTKISTVDVSGLSEKKALSLLKDQQQEWESNTAIIMKYKEKALRLNLNSFDFHLEESLEIANSQQKSELQVGINDKNLDSFLGQLSPDLVGNKLFDKASLKKELISYASKLDKGNHVIQVNNFFSTQQKGDVISESTIPFQDQNGEFDQWVQQFPSIVIGPQSSFSLLNQLEIAESYSSETLGKIAGAIYKAIIPTNFVITERHISRELPSYAEEGFEVKIDSSNNMDFVFTNPNDQTFTLSFKKMDQLLYVSVEGTKLPYSYKAVQNDKETFPPKTIIQYDAKLPLYSEKIAIKGKEGVIIKVFREKMDKDGSLLDKTLLAEDFYPPINQVIIHSLLTKGTASSTNTNNTNQTGEIGNSTSTPDPANPSTDTDTTNDGNINENTGTSESDTTENNQDSSDLWGKPNEEAK